MSLCGQNQFALFMPDLWREQMPWPFCILPALYRWVTGPGIPCWRFLWTFLHHSSMRVWLLKLITPLIAPQLVTYLRTVQPDIVVSLHPLMNHLGLEMMRRAELDVPFVTVVVDLVTAHPIWFSPDVTLCIVATEAARHRALRAGLSEKQVKVLGHPVRRSFIEQASNKHVVRQTMGLLPNSPVVLLVGSTAGRGPILETALAIAKQTPHVQMLIVCGENRHLYHCLKEQEWPSCTHVLGYVENMQELMAAADILVTKAGPSTISEALCMGLPIIVSNFIPGQEAGNVDYILENQVGVYNSEPHEIAHSIQTWLEPANWTLEEMSDKTRQIAQPRAAQEIAIEVCRQLQEKVTARCTCHQIDTNPYSVP